IHLAELDPSDGSVAGSGDHGAQSGNPSHPAVTPVGTNEVMLAYADLGNVEVAVGGNVTSLTGFPSMPVGVNDISDDAPTIVSRGDHAVALWAENDEALQAVSVTLSGDVTAVATNVSAGATVPHLALIAGDAELLSYIDIEATPPQLFFSIDASADGSGGFSGSVGGVAADLGDFVATAPSGTGAFVALGTRSSIALFDVDTTGVNPAGTIDAAPTPFLSLAAAPGLLGYTRFNLVTLSNRVLVR
ncbi:MAG TPA: hypothetical protein VGO62_12040, partial [Myxococcota bacterium]